MQHTLHSKVSFHTLVVKTMTESNLQPLQMLLRRASDCTVTSASTILFLSGRAITSGLGSSSTGSLVVRVTEMELPVNILARSVIFYCIWSNYLSHPIRIQGTWAFMSINVLQSGTEYKHKFQDDMESFFYVVLYASIRWLQHTFTGDLARFATVCICK